MRLDTILPWTLFLAPSIAREIESHLSTETSLQCSTLYSSSSVPTPLSTSTAAVASTTELSPVILHNYTTHTVTITPKPFETLWSVLATKTKTVEKEAVNGTLNIEVTKFMTKTFWHHVTTTATVTKEKRLTSRTTSWVSAPSGFKAVRNSSISQTEKKAEDKVDAISRIRRDSSNNSKKKEKKTVLQNPTKGQYAVAVECQSQIRIHTTETLLLQASTTATVTKRPETVYSNRTIYGTITSTILALPSTSTLSGSGVSSASASGSGVSSSTTSISQINSRDIITNTTRVTKTPYTISFTWTVTTTSTSTQTLHATTTLTSYLACATSNQLSQTSDNKRINGISLLEANEMDIQSLQTETASGCCEQCMLTKNCMWSIWEASGAEKETCHLFLFLSAIDEQTAVEDKKKEIDDIQRERREEEAAAGEEGKERETETCKRQEKQARFGYTPSGGEVRYVVSNGLCGMLVEA